MDPLVWFFYSDTYPHPIHVLADALGIIPTFLNPADDRPATEQFDERYQGGWDPMEGFSLIDGVSLKYPDDPLMNPIAKTSINGDTVLVYEYGWVCVVRPDRTYEVARLD